MKKFFKIVSYAVLIIMVVLAVLVFDGKVSIDLNKTLMLILTVIWFVVTPVWMLEKK